MNNPIDNFYKELAKDLQTIVYQTKEQTGIDIVFEREVNNVINENGHIKLTERFKPVILDKSKETKENVKLISEIINNVKNK